MGRFPWLPIEFTNELGMTFRLIPPGEFLMGSGPEEQQMAHEHLKQYEARVGGEFAQAQRWKINYMTEQLAVEKPQHPVVLTRPFYMGVHEVRQQDFAAFVEDTGYKTSVENGSKNAWVYDSVGKKRAVGFTWRHPGYEPIDQFPVTQVSWDDAAAFSQWLSKREGQKYRLPTEAQWEYTCRAGNQAPWPGYANSQAFKDVYLDDDWMDGIRKATFGESPDKPLVESVGTHFQANAFGLFDMPGNVFEWCQDRYGARYYDQMPHQDPQGPANGTRRVARGWTNGTFMPLFYRSSFRRFAPPDYSEPVLGIRVICDVVEP